jgi:hypothetical protein
MSLKFFADHCVPQSVTDALRQAGHDVFVLREHIARDSDDAAVIAKAQELGAILVSISNHPHSGWFEEGPPEGAYARWEGPKGAVVRSY